MDKTEPKKQLRDIFFREIPNARRQSTMWNRNFEFFYDAHLRAGRDTKVLNIICTHDTSARRETVYHEYFFNISEYKTVEYWEGKFQHEGHKTEGDYHIPYESNVFDVLVTTKIVLEHVPEPTKVLEEIYRVLKPGGEAFIISPLVRRQHQAPYDYFRFTEFGLKYLFDKVDFETVYIKHSNGYMETATQYAYFFQRGLNLPKPIEAVFDFFHKWVIEPVGFQLEKLDNGYGRDFALYFYSRVKKPNL